MPIFMSYSHHDRDFATRLAAQLVKQRARVWIDAWELHVGDSIVDRVQAALSGANALLVVLSRASVESQWCKKELSSGLLRELEEKRVVVLPVLLEDCEIPLFLRGKLYADFRTDFDAGLKAVMEAVALVTAESLGRLDDPEWHIDWSVDEGLLETQFLLTVTLVEQAKDQPYSVLTVIEILGNEVATDRWLHFVEAGLGWIEKAAIIDCLAEGTHDKDLRVVLEDERPQQREITLSDPNLRTRYHVIVTSRRLGRDTGRNILLDLGGQLRCLREAQRQSLSEPTPEERRKFEQLKATLHGSPDRGL
jgi:hypothetical protein